MLDFRNKIPLYRRGLTNWGGGFTLSTSAQGAVNARDGPTEHLRYGPSDYVEKILATPRELATSTIRE